MDRLAEYMQYAKSFIDVDWLKQHQVAVASSVGVSVCGLLYLYSRSQRTYNPFDEDVSSLQSAYNISSGQAYNKYPSDLRENWFLSTKLLAKFPLTFTAPSGAKISYNEFGDPSGVPVLHFHGSGGCTLEGTIYDAAAAKHGLRMIVMDRPGHGQSTIPEADLNSASFYTLHAYARDLAALLENELKLDKSVPLVLSGASQGGICATVMLGLLRKLGFNVRVCVLLAGMPVTQIGKLLGPAGDGKGADEAYFARYSEAMPPGVVDNYKLGKMVRVSKMLGSMFVWYNRRQNFKTHGKELNYNWALKFLEQQELLPQSDLDMLEKQVGTQSGTDAKGEKVALNSYYFSKLVGEYSYRFQEQSGERWTVASQWDLDLKKEDFFKDCEQVKVLEYHGCEDRLIPLKWVEVFHEDLEKVHGISVDRRQLEGQGHLIFTFENLDKAYAEVVQLLGETSS